MKRAAVLMLLLVASLSAATVRLYMKDGTWHNVREYQKQGDRVRFYSTERGDWEEIPADLVDFKKTESEIKQKADATREDARLMDAEEKAERAQEQEISRIPYEAGVFTVVNDQVITLKQAEAKSVNNKRRSILKAVTPIPVVSGKATVEIDGAKAALVLTKNLPEFYMRLNTDERFGIVRLSPTKSARIVQKWTVQPVVNEIIEETDTVETFKQELAGGLYKFWPTKPLAPGEYAVVEYTEGKGNIQVWDFSIAAQ